jgi:GT2 family glycosyltransferase
MSDLDHGTGAVDDSRPAALLPEPASEPVVSIMLVNWNTRELTLECLRSVYAQTLDTPFEVIVVDNGSHDGSAEAIAREFPQAVLMAEAENHGFAKATNISVERARGRYVLLLNTDTVVLDRAIDRLVAFADANPAARLWGGRTLFEDRSLNPDSVWGKITLWSVFCMATGLAKLFSKSELFNPECYGNWKRDNQRQVDIVQGSFLLIARDFWNDLGGFDPAFFMFGEEADLAARARARGARPLMTPAATILHYGGRSTKNFSKRIVYVFGGRIGLIRRHFSGLSRTLATMLTIFWVWWRSRLYILAARLSPRYAAQAEDWDYAWTNRHLWRNGPPSKRL